MMQSLETRLNTYSNAVLSLYRIVFGFLFTALGMSHAFDWPIAFPMVSTGDWPVWYAGVIETVTGLLIMVGLFTRIAAFIASGHMAVAYFWQHQPHALWPIVPPEMGGNGGLAAILFCFAFFLLIFTGPGSIALDAMIGRSRTTTSAAR
jgi:putative oxidoreductase